MKPVAWVVAAILTAGAMVAGAIVFVGTPDTSTAPPNSSPPLSATAVASRTPGSPSPMRSPTLSAYDEQVLMALDQGVAYLCEHMATLGVLLLTTTASGGALSGHLRAWRELEAAFYVDAGVFASLIGEPAVEGLSVGLLATDTRVLTTRVGQVALAIESGPSFPVAPERVIRNVSEIGDLLTTVAECG